MPRSRRRVAAARSTLAMATACGTTVSTSAVQQSAPASGGSGLGVPSAAGTPSTGPATVGTPSIGSGAGVAEPSPTAPAIGPDTTIGTPELPPPTTGPLKVGILYAVNDAA